MHVCHLSASKALKKWDRIRVLAEESCFTLQLKNSLELLVLCRELKILYKHNIRDNRVKRYHLPYLLASLQDLALFFTAPPPEFFSRVASRLLTQETNQILASLPK